MTHKLRRRVIWQCLEICGDVSFVDGLIKPLHFYQNNIISSMILRKSIWKNKAKLQRWEALHVVDIICQQEREREPYEKWSLCMQCMWAPIIQFCIYILILPIHIVIHLNRGWHVSRFHTNILPFFYLHIILLNHVS